MCEESINNKCVFDTHTLTHTHSTTCCANTKWMKQANNVSGNIYFTLFLLEYNALHPYVCRRACSRAVHTHDETHEKRKDTRRKKTHISDDHEDADDADDAETKTLSTMSDEFGTNGNRKCVEKRWRIKKKKKCRIHRLRVATTHDLAPQPATYITRTIWYVHFSFFDIIKWEYCTVYTIKSRAKYWRAAQRVTCIIFFRFLS